MSHELTQSIQNDSYAELRETLLFLLEECSLDETPSNDEIQQWQTILTQRGGKFLKLADICQKFLQENP